MTIRCNRSDCFGWNVSTHGCSVLNDTEFGRKSCPFYKTKVDLKQQLIEAGGRKATRRRERKGENTKA